MAIAPSERFFVLHRLTKVLFLIPGRTSTGRCTPSASSTRSGISPPLLA
jgi:hypothetical protein